MNQKFGVCEILSLYWKAKEEIQFILNDLSYVRVYDDDDDIRIRYAYPLKSLMEFGNFVVLSTKLGINV